MIKDYFVFILLGLILIIGCSHIIKRNYQSLKDTNPDWLSVSSQSSVIYAVIGFVFGIGIFLYHLYLLIKSL